MKKVLLLAGFFLYSGSVCFAQSPEYKTITVVESIVPNGLGRSRMISSEEKWDYRGFTSERSGENDERNKSDRGEIRLKNF